MSSHEHEAIGSRHAAYRGDRKAAAKQRMGRIGDLDLTG